MDQKFIWRRNQKSKSLLSSRRQKQKGNKKGAKTTILFFAMEVQ